VTQRRIDMLPISRNTGSGKPASVVNNPGNRAAG
jgi:hypothetical protein